jgi:hypothetical protein
MEEPLIDKFKRRANRFMEIISNKESKCLFFYIASHKSIQQIENNIIINTAKLFVETMNMYSRCEYILIIFFDNVNNNDEIILNNIYNFNENNKFVKLEPIFGKSNPNNYKTKIESCIIKYN